jgi:very-short-patch-repair endonuclease
MFTGVFRAPAPRAIAPSLLRERLAQVFAHKLLRPFVFKPQVAIGPYVVDYVCTEACLILELPHRRTRSTDHDARTAFLASMGYRVLRISMKDLCHPGRLALEVRRAIS